MIKAVECVNESGDSIRMTLASPESSGFAISSISGLGPEKANISITDNGSGDGGKITGDRVASKNIGINIVFFWFPGTTIEKLRHECYRYFPVKEKVSLTIITDERTLKIEGEVESNEPDIFSNQEGASISIMCEDPYFKARSAKSTVFSGLDKAFTFPFSNKSLDEELLILGYRKNSKSKVILYEGEVKTGVEIVMDFYGNVGDITVYHNNENSFFKIITSKIRIGNQTGLMYGDQIVLSTIKGSKKLVLIRNNKEYKIYNSIGKNVSWFELSKGYNNFSYVVDNYSNIDFKINIQKTYKGV